MVVGGDEGEFQLAVAARTDSQRHDSFSNTALLINHPAVPYVPPMDARRNSPCRLEHSCINLDLLNTRSKQRLQRRRDSRLLARTGRSIDE